MKALEKYECHPLYKFCKELDHPGFDSRRGQASFLFIQTSCPSLRVMRPLNGERVLSLEVKRTMCEADHSLLSGAEVKNECKYSSCPGQRQLYLEKHSTQFWECNVATGIRKELHSVKLNTSDSGNRVKLCASAPARDTPCIRGVK